MLEEVRRDTPSSPGYLCDLKDGEFFKQHQVFSKHPTALQFVLYYDELEVCNPLGSKNKIHKLGIAITMYKHRLIILLRPIIRCLLLHTGQYQAIISLYIQEHTTVGNSVIR